MGGAALSIHQADGGHVHDIHYKNIRVEMCIRDRAEGTAKEDLPFSKYAEPVKVHLGGSMNPNAKIPDGMSYEDNSCLLYTSRCV